MKMRELIEELQKCDPELETTAFDTYGGESFTIRAIEPVVLFHRGAAVLALEKIR